MQILQFLGFILILFKFGTGSFLGIEVMPDIRTKTPFECIGENKTDFIEEIRNETRGIVDLNVTNEIETTQTRELSPAEEFLKNFASSSKSKWYIPKTTNGTICRSQISDFTESLMTGQNWALEMVDSWGKFSNGILQGNKELPGLYDECLQSSTQDGHIHGKYCTIYYRSTAVGQIHGKSEIELRARLGVLSGRNISQLVLPYSSYGTCVPNGCTEEDMLTGLEDVMKLNKKELVRVTCRSSTDPSKISLGSASFIIYIGLVASIMVCAFILKRVPTYKYKGLQRFVMAFSLEDNVKKILTIDQEETEGSIKCIHGLRVITMMFIHLCHEIGMTVHSSNMAASYVGQRDSFAVAFIISNASLGVDTFLFISGLLISHGAMRSLTNFKMGSIPALYLQRFMRLSLPILITTWFFATMGGLLFEGPWFSEFSLIENACKKYWWKDVFFLFNFFPKSDSDNAFATCLGQCWYTAVDFQLFLLAPALLFVVLKWPSIAKTVLTTLALVSFVIPTAYIYQTGLPPTNILKFDEKKNYEYFTRIYSMPWHRAAPWMIGFLTGYIMVKSPLGKMSKNCILSGWMASMSIGVMVLARMTYLNLNPKHYDTMDDISSALYGGTHRGLWSISLAWIVFASQHNHPGIGSFLSYPGFQPLSRLAYPIYLISLNTQFALSWSVKSQVYTSLLTKIIDASGSFVICVFFGFVLSLMTESPLLNLMKRNTKTAPAKKYS